MSSDEPREETEEVTPEENPYEVTGEAPRADRTGRYLVLGSAALALAGLIVAAVFGIQWWVASADDNLDLAQAREDVIRTGTTAVKAYTELDYTNPDAYFAQQKAVSTQELADQIAATEQNYRQAMTDAKTKVTTTVQEIAVEELDLHGGKASFLAAISTLVAKEGAQPAAKPLRLEVQMTRVGDDWKVSGIGSVPLVSGQ
jgi:Mce-associated membrane protein